MAEKTAHAPAVAAAGIATTSEPRLPPSGAACWICLDGDPDEAGKPIVRDCSCRGDDAGFAHLSCLVKYAEGKTTKILVLGEDDPNEPWQKCPHCRQTSSFS